MPATPASPRPPACLVQPGPCPGTSLPRLRGRDGRRPGRGALCPRPPDCLVQPARVLVSVPPSRALLPRGRDGRRPGRGALKRLSWPRPPLQSTPCCPALSLPRVRGRDGRRPGRGALTPCLPACLASPGACSRLSRHPAPRSRLRPSLACALAAGEGWPEARERGTYALPLRPALTPSPLTLRPS